MFNFLKKKEAEPENLQEILSQFKDLKENFQKISADLEELKSVQKMSLQKVGMVRFNPFSGVGSDQSFSIALLDANNSGVVLTSLYTREESRTYGKPIKNGQSKYTLSDEEKKAVEKAINNQDEEGNGKKNNAKKRGKNSPPSGSGGLGSY